MLMIVIRTIGANDEVLDTVAAPAPADRQSTRRALDELIAHFKSHAAAGDLEAAGYDAKQDYWWVRWCGRLRRYTIETLHGAAETIPKAKLEDV